MCKWYKGMVRQFRWNVKPLFCKHHFKLIGHHRIVTEDLYGCIKCGVYRVHHPGMGLSFNTQKINEKDWKVLGR